MAQLNVSSHFSEIRSSVSIHNGSLAGAITRIGGSSLPFSVNNSLWELIPEIERFERLLRVAADEYNEERYMTETLGTFLDDRKFSDAFVTGEQ